MVIIIFHLNHFSSTLKKITFVGIFLNIGSHKHFERVAKLKMGPTNIWIAPTKFQVCMTRMLRYRAARLLASYFGAGFSSNLELIYSNVPPHRDLQS